MAQRVAASALFQRSARLRDFLLYVCEKTLKNCQEELREQQIGVSVFHRPPGYNPSEDNIVRVEARELRRRLGNYFATEGRDEPITIHIPKGAYVPVFTARVPATCEMPPEMTGEEQRADQIPAIVDQEPKTPPSRSRREKAVPFLLGLVILSLFIAGWLWRENQAQRSALKALQKSPPALRIWPLLFNPEKPTTLAVSDIAHVLLRRLTKTNSSLPDYLSRKYLTNLDKELQFVSTKQWTTLADLRIVSRLSELIPGSEAQLRVVHPWNLQLQDLKTGNVIFLGGKWSNPWVELFEDQRNFRLASDWPGSSPYYTNRSPRPGEEAAYHIGVEYGKPDDSYGLIVFLPNINRSGNVLIIEGVTSEGVEAAGDFFTDPKAFSQFEEKLKSESQGGALPYFELLVKTHRLNGTFKEALYVAHRRIHP